jgi:hypothetical protein
MKNITNWENFNSINEARIVTTEKDPVIKEKYDKLIGKTVKAFRSETEDKILDFGKKNTLYRAHNMRIPANPMGYAVADGTYFLVLRNGYNKVVLSPTFGDLALRALDKQK